MRTGFYFNSVSIRTVGWLEAAACQRRSAVRREWKALPGRLVYVPLD